MPSCSSTPPQTQARAQTTPGLFTAVARSESLLSTLPVITLLLNTEKLTYVTDIRTSESSETTCIMKKKKLYTDFKFFCNKNKFPFIFTVEVLLCHLKCTKRYPLVVAPTKVAGRHKIQAFKTKNLKIFKDANGKRNRNLSSRCGSSLT